MTKESKHWDWWESNLAEKLVLCYCAQGGTEYSKLQPHMYPLFNYLLEHMGDELHSLYRKGFDHLNDYYKEVNKDRLKHNE